MKTLSVKQPYSSLIVEGVKDIENRTYKTKVRGTVLIHASAKWHDRGGNIYNLFTSTQLGVLTKELNTAYDFAKEAKVQELLTRAAIIGQVDIVDCVQDSTSIWAEPGAWHWVLENAVAYQHPILDVKGALSFWDFDPAKMDKLVIANAVIGGSYEEIGNHVERFINPFIEGRDFMVNQSASEKNIIYTIQHEK